MRRYFGVKWFLANLQTTVLFSGTPVEKWGGGASYESEDSGLQGIEDKPKPRCRAKAAALQSSKAKCPPRKAASTSSKPKGANPEIRQYKESKTNQNQDAGLKPRLYNELGGI